MKDFHLTDFENANVKSEKVENGIQSCCILVNTSFQTPCVQCSILISMSYLWAKVVKKTCLE